MKNQPNTPMPKSKIINEDLEKIRCILQAPDQSINQGVISALLAIATNCGSSDVHLEPTRDDLLVRFRIDGTLYDVFTVPKNKEQNILSCLKVMANLNIAEKRLPQDGRLEIKFKNSMIKIRVSTMQQIFGEKAVVRIFGQHLDLSSFESLGFMPENKEKFEQMIYRKSGLVIVTGATNSGKTTTLYAAMNKLKKPDINIISVEDPVEYVVERINQIQVNPAINFDFNTVLRAVLRQDPDVVIIGEIRDFESAHIATRAALTGHLILTTFHAHRPTICITRLIDMGIMPFLLASSLNGIVVQKLARRICPNCITELKESDLGLLGGIPHYKGKGCNVCNFTGSRGRIALHEIMVVSGSIKKLIQEKAESVDIFKQARTEGMKTMQEDALEKVKTGIISLEEAVSLTSD